LADRAGHKLLDDVSLRIAAGSRVAIMASDERTPLALLGLLPRCYDPAAGRVLFDGHDIRKVTLDSLRRETALVSPTGLLRNVSIADNISWGDPKFAPRHITRAAKWAQAYSFVQQLPHGFSTIIDEDSHRLTPSEALRIGLARALLREPSILVLEEPPGDLDPQTAELVDEAIAKVSKDRTLVSVTARLNTLRRADRVFLFHQGKLFAEGTHSELLQTCELYRHLQYIRFNEFRHAAPQPQAVTGSASA
jgi:ATP-binding cassette subfamily B protein